MKRFTLSTFVAVALPCFAFSCTTGLLGESLNSRNLPERERVLSESTDAGFSELAACSKRTDGNDLAFQNECAPLLTGKEILVFANEIKTDADARVTIDADIPNRTLETLHCNLVLPTDEAARQEFLATMATVQKGDLVILRIGELRKYSRLTTVLENCQFVGRGAQAG
jgi:hypothetical protein